MKWVCWSCLIFPSVLCAQTVQLPDRSVQTDPIVIPENWMTPFSANANPALLSGQQHLMFSLFSEMPFRMPEMTRHQLDVLLPVGKNGISFGIDQRKAGGMQKNQVSWGMGHHLGRLDLGVQLQFSSIKSQGFKPEQLLSTSVGIVWDIREHWQLAMVVSNPVKSALLGGEGQRPALEIRSAFCMTLSEQLGLMAGYDYIETLPASWRADLFYQVQQRLRVSLGFESGRHIMWLRAGWTIGVIHLFSGLEYHSYLGVTPSMGLVLTAAKKEG